MTEIVGGVMMMVGGGAMSASSIALVRDLRPIERARELLAGAFAAPASTPADMAELLGDLDRA